MIEIEKGIEMPRSGIGFRGNPTYPWRTMEVGDSFFHADEPGKKNIGHAVAAGATKRYPPKRFAARKVNGGIRIWRVS